MKSIDPVCVSLPGLVGDQDREGKPELSGRSLDEKGPSANLRVKKKGGERGGTDPLTSVDDKGRRQGASRRRAKKRAQTSDNGKESVRGPYLWEGKRVD